MPLGITPYKKVPGRVLWITGLSGAGKSTIARQIQIRLLELQIAPLILDGDLVRDAIRDPNWGFDEKSRLSGSFRYSRLAKLAAEQGLTVIVPTISLFHEVQQWNRQHLSGYFEVYLRTTELTRRQRDPKVLYADHQNGIQTQMAGLDYEIQAPLNPDMLIDNDLDVDEEALSALAGEITRRFLQETGS